MIIQDENLKRWLIAADGVEPIFSVAGDLRGFHVDGGDWDDWDCQEMANRHRLTVRDYRGAQGSLQAVFFPNR